LTIISLFTDRVRARDVARSSALGSIPDRGPEVAESNDLLMEWKRQLPEIPAFPISPFLQPLQLAAKPKLIEAFSRSPAIRSTRLLDRHFQKIASFEYALVVACVPIQNLQGGTAFLEYPSESRLFVNNQPVDKSPLTAVSKYPQSLQVIDISRMITDPNVTIRLDFGIATKRYALLLFVASSVSNAKLILGISGLPGRYDSIDRVKARFFAVDVPIERVTHSFRDPITLTRASYIKLCLFKLQESRFPFEEERVDTCSVLI
jgi:hypothetical protein